MIDYEIEHLKTSIIELSKERDEVNRAEVLDHARDHELEDMADSKAAQLIELIGEDAFTAWKFDNL